MALLDEEEWGVASFLDFVARILPALAVQTPTPDADIAVIHVRFSKDPAAESFAVVRLQHHTRDKTTLLLRPLHPPIQDVEVDALVFHTIENIQVPVAPESRAASA